MPTPGQATQVPMQPNFDRFFAALRGEEPQDLAYQVAELRKEIAELRSELAPVPSLIITGRQALDEFKRLTRTGGAPHET